MADHGPRWVSVGEPGADRASIADLVRGVAQDATHLLCTEVKLAKAEVRANVAGLVSPIVLLLAAALLGIAALFTLMGAFVGWLAPHVGPGLAAFIVAVGVGALAVVLALIGLNRFKAVSLAPTRTLESVRRDVATVKSGAA